ncbi:MAG: tol-pal system protein YbgF, partial [Alphaproteobacteria bacterium]
MTVLVNLKQPLLQTTAVLATVLLFVLMMCAVAPRTYAQQAGADIYSLLNRLERLERRVVAVEQKVFPASGLGAGGDTELRLQEIERESTSLYGAVEKLGNAVQQLSAKMDKLTQDMEFRLQELEKGGVKTPLPQSKTETNEQGETVPADAKPTAQKAKDTLPAEELYKQAYGLLTAAQYPQAQEHLELFLQKFPDHKLADNAHYWLGEVLLVQGKPDQAVIAFKNGITAFPKGNKAPGNLLKMASAFEKMGQLSHMRAVLVKLRDDFPETPEGIKAKA